MKQKMTQHLQLVTTFACGVCVCFGWQLCSGFCNKMQTKDRIPTISSPSSYGGKDASAELPPTFVIAGSVERIQISLKNTGQARYDPCGIDDIPGKNFQRAYNNYMADYHALKYFEEAK